MLTNQGLRSEKMNFLKMEDDLNFLENGRQHNLFVKDNHNYIQNRILQYSISSFSLA